MKTPCVGDKVRVMVDGLEHWASPGVYDGTGRHGERMVWVDVVFCTGNGYQVGEIVERGPLGQAIDRADSAEAESEMLRAACDIFEENSRDATELWELLREIHYQSNEELALTPGLRDRIRDKLLGEK